MHKAPIGKRPANCFRDPKSPFWQYDFSIAGERERGTTRERTAAKAAAYVEGRKALMRKRQAETAMGISAPTMQRISLFDACERFEAQFRKLDKTTELQIGTLCAVLCVDGRDRMLHEITTADFDSYRRLRGQTVTRRGTVVCGATINREVELARRIWLRAAALDSTLVKCPTGRRSSTRPPSGSAIANSILTKSSACSPRFVAAIPTSR